MDKCEFREMLPCGPVRGTIRPPGSKSITNRALLCAALATGSSELSGALDSEDTQVMLEALRQLGIEIIGQPPRLTVRGCAGTPPVRSGRFQVGNSGTTIRFLTAALVASGGSYRLDGVARMRQRPIGDLLEALVQLGGGVESELANGCPPVLIDSQGLAGGRATVRGDISSQFLSGLLMAAPLARADVQLLVEGQLVSQPYVSMTLKVMEAFGIRVPDSILSEGGPIEFRIAAPQNYQATRYTIEPDASAASYFFAAAAISGGDVVVEGLSRQSLQGDVALVNCLARMGCEVVEQPGGIRVRGGPLQGINVDMNAISDTVQTLSVVALFASGPTTIRGVAHIRHKETDRIGDLARELRALGAEVNELADGLCIHPRPLHGAELETYRDHRMAMSLALAGLRVPGVRILNPRCVEKTYPEFFADLDRLIGASQA